MSKLIYLFTLMLISSCISYTKKSSTLSYQSLHQLKINSSTKEEIINKFGLPDEVKNNDGTYQTLIYNDKKTKYHRTSINISTANNRIINYLWIPFEGEKESKFDGAISNFGKTSFEELPDIYSLPHFISSTVRVKDKKNGISIMYNKHTKSVDAIGFFGSPDRTTSSQ